VTWRSFQLDSDAVSGAPVRDMLMRKYRIDAGQLAGMQSNLANLAQSVGLAMKLDTLKTANTFDAHRALHLATQHGVGPAAHERLFRAYFEENLPVDAPSTLTTLLGEVGVPKDASVALFSTNAFADDVRADLQLANELGIRGVPCFVFDRQTAVSGAQEPAVLREAMARAFRVAHSEQVNG
jgi:predicted DsbA family dithiol-disulfide isomerase